MATGKTRYSKPIRLSKDTPVGQETWLTYRAAYPGAHILTTPRIRILSVYTPALEYCAWDLDALTPEDRSQLLKVVVDRKIVVAHDAGFLFSWLFGETSARPDEVLYTSLLVHQIRPTTLLRPFRMVVAGNADTRSRARGLIEREGGGPSSSLEWIAAIEDTRVPLPRCTG
jgi:hypothetical protein